MQPDPLRRILQFRFAIGSVLIVSHARVEKTSELSSSDLWGISELLVNDPEVLEPQPMGSR